MPDITRYTERAARPIDESPKHVHLSRQSNNRNTNVVFAQLLHGCEDIAWVARGEGPINDQHFAEPILGDVTQKAASHVKRVLERRIASRNEPVVISKCLDVRSLIPRQFCDFLRLRVPSDYDAQL